MSHQNLFTGIFVQIALLAIALRWLILYVLDTKLPASVVQHATLLGLVLAFALVCIDRTVIDPRFRSPLRHLPTVKWANVIGERPRGHTVLQWFKQQPHADMIVMRGIKGTLFPASPEALRDITNTHSYDWEKAWGIRAFIARIIGFGLILSEGDAHRRQRKHLTPTFHIRNIRNLYATMWDKTTILLTQLEAENAQQGYSEITTWASRLTLDVIGPAALSRDFNTLTTSEDHMITTAFHTLLDPSPELVAFMVSNMFLPQWFATRLPVRANRLINQQCPPLRALCRTILQEKHSTLKKASNAEEGREHDILQHIIETGEFSDEELVDQMLTFLAAGHETTASALTWSMYLLALHPATQSRLRDELHTHIPDLAHPSSSPCPSPTLLETLPVLNGVIEEVLRLYPTVPTTIRQCVRPTTVAGTAVQKDTVALIVPYALNRHPLHWGPDAEVFNPDRWIDVVAAPTDDKPSTLHLNKHGGATSNFANSTFLHGPRACIGRDFARAEMRCAVAGLVGRFRIRLAEPEREVVVGGTVTTKPVGGLKVVFEMLN